MTNLNDMARRIAKHEGGQQSLSIAQVKEVLRLALRELKALSVAELIALLARVK